PGVTVAPTGLIFVTQAGTTSPASKTFTVSTAFTGVTATITAATSQGGNWLTVNPGAANVSVGSPQTITVQAAIGNLSAGVYTGTLTLSFSNGSPTQTVNVLFVVSAGVPAASGPSAIEKMAAIKDATTCTPQKLVAVFQALGNNFS